MNKLRLVFSLLLLFSSVVWSGYLESDQDVLIPQEWAHVDRVGPTEELELTFALKQQNVHLLEEKLRLVSDPDSVQYGKHLSLEEVASLVRPSDLTEKVVHRWLQSHGITNCLTVRISMKVCHILFCVIFLHLQDGNTGLANAETLVYERVEGGNITFECKFVILGRKTLFCKDKCEKGNVLIETADYTAQSGRYSIKYEKNYFSKDIVHVSITQLNKSDAGLYRSTLDTSFEPCDFQLVITGASDTPTSHEPLSTSTFLLSASTTTTTTTTTHFSSGSFTPSSTSPETPSSGSGADKLLYMILTLVLMIIILSATLLIFYKNRKAIKPKGPPVETEYANITRAKQEIREGAPQRKVEMSSIYTSAKGPQPDGAENIDLYNLNTCSQNKAEDDMNKVNYAEVDFSHIPATNSASLCKTDEVVYSTPLVHTSPSSLTTDASPPLYSAVKKQY